MRKILRVLSLVVAVVMMLCSCSIVEVDDVVVSTQSPTKGNEIHIPTETTEPVEELNTVEEQVLLESDGVKITLREYVKDSIFGEGLKVLVENTSDKNIGIHCNAVIVNNYMITDFFSCSVAAGKKSNETIYLLSYELEAAGIDNIGQIELYFNVYNSDTYDTIFESDCVTVHTSAYAEMDVTPFEGGTELYNQDGIRIVGTVVDESSFWGSAVLLYLENNSNDDVIVSCDDMSINGFMVDGYLYSMIYAGKMAVDEIIILQTDLDENEIKSVEDIELAFYIINADTYMTITKTEPIKFSVG